MIRACLTLAYIDLFISLTVTELCFLTEEAQPVEQCLTLAAAAIAIH